MPPGPRVIPRSTWRANRRRAPANGTRRADEMRWPEGSAQGIANRLEGGGVAGEVVVDRVLARLAHEAVDVLAERPRVHQDRAAARQVEPRIQTREPRDPRVEVTG